LNHNGKAITKIVTNPATGTEENREVGQAGKAADGGDRIRPGTLQRDAYCARSAKIKGNWKSDPNSPNNLSAPQMEVQGKQINEIT
jgi:hypothetical protein